MIPPEESCGNFILRYPDRPFGPGRHCRNRNRPEFNQCEPCYRRAALRWVDKNPHATRYVLYLQSKGYAVVMGDD